MDRSELVEKLEQAVISDYEMLRKEAGDDEVFGCAILTDSDFITANLVMNVETDEEVEPHERWYAEEWPYWSSSYEEDALDELSEPLQRLWDTDEGGKETVLPMFIQALSRLKEHLHEQGVATDDICFFVTISDDEDMLGVENHSAQQLNAGPVLDRFLDRYAGIDMEDDE